MRARQAAVLAILASRSQAAGRAVGIRFRTGDGPTVALTFDDGPHPDGTPAVLEALAREGAVATFFLVGEQVARRPSLAAEIVAAGHAVGLHCERHRPVPLLRREALADDLRRAAARIEDATGAPPRCYRPPYGAFSAAALRWARAHGLPAVRWSADTKDWRAGSTPRSILERAERGLSPGAIVLMHDADHYADEGCWRRTVAAIPELVALLRARALTPAVVA